MPQLFHRYRQMRPQAGKALRSVLHRASRTAKTGTRVCLAVPTAQVWEDGSPNPGLATCLLLPFLGQAVLRQPPPSLSLARAACPPPHVYTRTHAHACTPLAVASCAVDVPWPGPLPSDTPSGRECVWLRGKGRGSVWTAQLPAWVEVHGIECFHAASC